MIAAFWISVWLGGVIVWWPPFTRYLHREAPHLGLSFNAGIGAMIALCWPIVAPFAVGAWAGPRMLHRFVQADKDQ